MLPGPKANCKIQRGFLREVIDSSGRPGTVSVKVFNANFIVTGKCKKEKDGEEKSEPASILSAMQRGSPPAVQHCSTLCFPIAVQVILPF